MTHMLKRIITLLALFTTTLWALPTLATATRLARPDEKSAIVRALTSPVAACVRVASRRSCGPAISRGIPLWCTKVYISTVNPTWASETDVLTRACVRWAANGVAVVHRTQGRWAFITDGSAFLNCPIRAYNGRGAIPDPVAKDLLGVC